MKLYTTAEVADILGVSSSRVRQIADEMGIRPYVAAPRAYLWRASHVLKMKRRPTRGRPKN